MKVEKVIDGIREQVRQLLLILCDTAKTEPKKERVSKFYILVSPEDAYDRMPLTCFVKSEDGLNRLGDIEEFKHFARQIEHMPSLLDESILPNETDFILVDGKEEGNFLGLFHAISECLKEEVASIGRPVPSIEIALHDSSEVILI